MRITWNQSNQEFQVELQQGAAWSTEQTAAKQAGFKTTGPPDWLWTAKKAAVLTKLRTVKPTSGCTISTDARLNYDRLKAVEDANAEVLRQLKDAKKSPKKETAEKIESGEITGTGFEYDQDGWAIIEPLDSGILHVKYIPPLPTEFCTVCHEPVYFFERHDPLVCLDCEFQEIF